MKFNKLLVIGLISTTLMFSACATKESNTTIKDTPVESSVVEEVKEGIKEETSSTSESVSVEEQEEQVQEKIDENFVPTELDARTLYQNAFNDVNSVTVDLTIASDSINLFGPMKFNKGEDFFISEYNFKYEENGNKSKIVQYNDYNNQLMYLYDYEQNMWTGNQEALMKDITLNEILPIEKIQYILAYDASTFNLITGLCKGSDITLFKGEVSKILEKLNVSDSTFEIIISFNKETQQLAGIKLHLIPSDEETNLKDVTIYMNFFNFNNTEISMPAIVTKNN